MKKIILSAVVILISGFIVFGQTSVKGKKTRIRKNAPKVAVKQAKTAVVKLEREKFDPTRDAAKDLLEAIAKAQKSGKRIILDIGGEWCGWCVKMDYYFLENKALAKLRDDNFIWLKVNFSPENENKELLTKFPPVSTYPHLFVLETNGSLLHSQDTAQLEEPNLPIMVKQGESGRETARKKAYERGYDLFKFVEFLRLWSSQ